MRLVADIGGTNARLALAEKGLILPDTVRSFANGDWPHFYDILAAYLKDHSSERLNDIVLAVAGPVHGDRAVLTNRNWTICTADLVRSTNCESAALLNDLTALGNAVQVLSPDQLRLFHGGVSQYQEVSQSLVVGIGTGFNASPVLKTADAVRCLNVEAGHVSMPRSISTRLDEGSDLACLFPTVEELFSGRGFTAFCRQVSDVATLRGIDAIASYGKPDAEAITSAVDQYSALLGQLLRELALTYMPDSGIYLAGSVARAIMGVAPLPCTEVFTKPCNFRFDTGSDLFVVTDDGAALHGCAAFG
jgi:glucokinase